jgi:hypothetical protein
MEHLITRSFGNVPGDHCTLILENLQYPPEYSCFRSPQNYNLPMERFISFSMFYLISGPVNPGKMGKIKNGKSQKRKNLLLHEEQEIVNREQGDQYPNQQCPVPVVDGFSIHRFEWHQVIHGEKHG